MDAGGRHAPRVLDEEAMAALVARLVAAFDEVLAPVRADGTLVVAPIDSALDLPRGVGTRLGPGRFRLVETAEDTFFQHGPGPQAWKRVLWPPEETVARVRRDPDGHLEALPVEVQTPSRALFGVRACDLAAIGVHDQVLAGGPHPDPGFVARRAAAFVVAVSCTSSAPTCFCASLGTGPAAGEGADVVLTEIVDEPGRVVAEARTPRGAELLGALGRAAGRADLDAATAMVESAARAQVRGVDPAALPELMERLEAPTWEQVAERCLACGNCTAVCPTCFCTTVTDVTDLAASEVERVRRWDSCFTSDFAYLHGGTVRGSTASRYRQWLLHKLTTWWAQFGTTGCVGCGRCITWCPVGIDITEEAALALAAAPPRRSRPAAPEPEVVP